MLLEEMSKDQLLALCKRWEKAHCQPGVNLIGSEYYADPERVFERVKYVFESRHQMMIDKVLKERRERETLEAQTEAAKDAQQEYFQDFT